MELAPQTGSFWQGPAIDGLALGGRRGCKQPLVTVDQSAQQAQRNMWNLAISPATKR